MKVFEKLWQHWCKFWFEPKDLFLLCLFRSLLGGLLFVMYSIRQVEWRLFFSNDGLLHFDEAKSFTPEFMQSSLPFIFESGSAYQFLHLLFLALLLFMALGLLNRPLSFVCFLLHVMFLQRNPSIIYGADLISTFWLLGFSFVRSNTYFSVLNLVRKARKKVTETDLFGSVFFRLMQIQLCIMYAYTGLEKLKGSTWWEGTAVWYVMANENIVPVDLSFMSHLPWAIAGMTFLTLIFEIYFPLAIWLKPTRGLWLLLGLGLHGLSIFFMGLPFFGGIMIASYLLFMMDYGLRDRIGSIKMPPKISTFVG